MEPTINTPEVAPSQPPQEIKPILPKKDSALTVILSAFLIVATVIAALLVYQNQKLVKQLKQYQPSSATPNPSPSFTPDPTADWKDYKNTALGFELKYPADVEVDKELNDQNNRLVIFKGGELHFEIRLIKYSGNTVLDNYYYLDSPITRKIPFRGDIANVYESLHGYCDGPECTEPYVAFVIEKGSDLFHFTFFGDTIVSETENQIFSTIKFLFDTSNWKTWKSDYFKFSINYPPNMVLDAAGNDYGNSGYLILKKGAEEIMTISLSDDFAEGGVGNHAEGKPVGKKMLAGYEWNYYNFLYTDKLNPETSYRLIAYETVKDNLLYVVEIKNKTELTDEQNEILSTFKFTN